MLEQNVYRFLQSLNIYYPNEIDLDIITDASKAEIRSTKFRSHCTFHPEKKGWKLICITEGLSTQEWREKVAHELCHRLLHFTSHLVAAPLHIQRHENQANHFASYLLVPFYMFQKLELELKHINHYEQGIHWIMEQFKVPYHMAEKRWNEWNQRNLCTK